MEADIIDLMNKATYKKLKVLSKFKPGDIIKYGYGKYYQINIKLLQWYGSQRKDPDKFNALT